MDGVTDVTLSLNEGSADVRFADPNSVTLDAIRSAIRRSGFSGEGGTVSVRGTATPTNGALEIRTPAGEVFVVTPVRDEDAAGTMVEATGRVEKEPDPQGRWVLRADEVRSVAGQND